MLQSFAKTLVKTGAPALGVLIAMTAWRAIKGDMQGSLWGELETNFLLVATLWAFVTPMVWLTTRYSDHRSARKSH